MSLLAVRGLLFAGECFAVSLLLPLLGFAVTALLRRAALRHLIWTTLFGVLAVLPVAALLLPPRRIVEHVAVPVAALPVAAAPVTPSLFTLENLVLAFAAIWLGGLIWQMLRVGAGAIGLRRLRRDSAPFVAPVACAVRLAADESGPSTFGILRPVVLLPRSATGWTAARLEAVLRHECAHVARRDTASQFIARLVCALYWPNPLLWLGLCAARRDAEIAADDAVLAAGMTPSAYAAELVALAGESRGLTPGIAMARPPLTRRVQSVLAENSSRKGVSRMDIAKTVSFGLAATLLLGTARFDLAVAQDAPAPRVEVAPKVEQPVDAVVPPQADADAARKRDADAMRQAGAAMRAGAQAREQAGAAMRDAAAARAKADAGRAQADAARQAAERIADPALSPDERIAATKAVSEAALAHAQDDLAKQVQMLKRSGADVAKQRMVQMAADAVAQARTRMAEAIPPSEGPVQASASRSDSVTINGHTFSGNVQMKTSRPGSPIVISADKMTADLPRRGAPSQINTARKNFSTRDGWQIDVQVTPNAAEAMNRPEVSSAIRDAVRMAMDEATKKISDAIATARAKAGLQPGLPSDRLMPPAPPPPAPVPPPPYAPN